MTTKKQFYNQSYVDLSFTSTYTKQIIQNQYARTYIRTIFRGVIDTGGVAPSECCINSAKEELCIVIFL